MASEQDVYDAYHELCCYTLAHGDASFIHQHVVDAFAAQRADAQSKPIGVTMARVGLYLHVEKQFSGRQVQRAHMQLARQKRPWPAFALPVKRGSMRLLKFWLRPRDRSAIERPMRGAHRSGRGSSIADRLSPSFCSNTASCDRSQLDGKALPARRIVPRMFRQCCNWSGFGISICSSTSVS